MANKCKYYKQQEFVSYDGGSTWNPTGNYRQGDLIEYQSSDCPSFAEKYKATYNDGRTYSAECTSQNETVAQADVRASGYDYARLIQAELGNCVTSVGSAAFSQCSAITSVILSDNLTSIGSLAFDGCTSLTSITIPSGVTSIGHSAFYNCSGITSITIPSGVTSIDNYVFYSCRGLTNVTIQNGVTSIGDNAFAYCSNLANVAIPNGVTTIGSNTYYFSGIVNVTLGDSITSIGNSAFYNSYLESFTINTVTPPSLGSGVFNSTNNLTIYVPSASVNTYKAASGWSAYASKIQAIP